MKRGAPAPFAQRVAIKQAVASGMSQRETAKQLQVARETVRKYAPKPKQ